jgi:hypothetical protein
MTRERTESGGEDDGERLYHEDGAAEVHAAGLAEAIGEDSMLCLFEVTARGKTAVPWTAETRRRTSEVTHRVFSWPLYSEVDIMRFKWNGRASLYMCTKMPLSIDASGRHGNLSRGAW